jgi:hypothetical protein
MTTETISGTRLAVFGGQHPVPPKQAAGIIGAVAAIASRDMVRLAGVHVEHDPDTRGIILTATDSYRLLSVTVPSVVLDGATFDPVTVYAADLARAAKNVAKGSAMLSISHVAGASNHVTVAGDSGSVTVPVDVTTFPNYRKLFDVAGDVWPAATDSVRVNPELFAGLFDSCAAISGYADRPKDAPLPEVDIVRMSATKVTMITGTGANGVSFRGLIMPVRK